MEYQQLVILILALFGLGAACRRVHASKRVFRVIDLLIIWVLFPAVIFSSITRPERVLLGGPVILACFGLAASAVISAIVITRARMSVETGAGVALNACFMNYAYLGLPVVYSLLGEEGLVVAVLYGVIVGIFHLTIGVAFTLRASGKRFNPRLIAGELLAFPPIFAMILALTLATLRFYPPSIVLEALAPLIHPMTVLMLLFVGYNMRFVAPRKYSRELLTVGSIRFVACPLVTYAGAWLMRADSIMVQSTLILSLMPPALLNLVIAKRFRLNIELSGAMIFYLTLLSLFAVTPLVAFLPF